MGLDIGLSDVPKPWRPLVAFFSFVFVVFGVAVVALTSVRSIARAEALVVVTEDRDSFKRAALEAAQTAAREGSEKAVREALYPLATTVQAHIAVDEQRQVETERRLERLDGIARRR